MTRKETNAFYRKHYLRIFNISLRIVRSSADAEEIMQDTILKYIESAPPGLTDMQAGAWLARAAIRRSIDLIRKKHKEELLAEELGSSEDTAIEEAPSTTELPRPEVIAQKIRELPPPYGMVLSLVLIEGLDYQEISQYTGIKETTLRSHYSRGLDKLRKSLK